MNDRQGLRKGAAVFFFAATWIALIVAVIAGTSTASIVLHAIAASLGLVALVLVLAHPRPQP